MQIRTIKTPFNFIEEIANGKTLFVGEGNLSFALSITNNNKIDPYKITATTFEKRGNLLNQTEINACILKSLGVSVIHSIDATKMAGKFSNIRFHNIIFQFPNSFSRIPIEGKNPNFILVRDFLKSAKYHLNFGGKVCITLVNSPYYTNAFQIEMAAKIANFTDIEIHPFHPNRFMKYIHATQNDGGGNLLGKYSSFITYVISCQLYNYKIAK